MESNGPLDALPLWGVFVAILIVVLLSVECGYRLGRYRRNRHEQEKETPVGTMVAMQKKKIEIIPPICAALSSLKVFKMVGVGAGSQRLIPIGERSGLQKHIAVTESVSLCVRRIRFLRARMY